MSRGSLAATLLLAVACGRLPLGSRETAADAGLVTDPARDGGLGMQSDTQAPDAAAAQGSSADAGATAELSPAPSCRAQPRCGAAGLSCCSTRSVPGGTFDFGLRSSETTASRASVATFELDVFEVTVGRFREFVADYDRWRANATPALSAGTDAGGQPLGFDALPADSAALQQGLLRCDMSPYSSWNGAGDVAPLNCASWLEASAFCSWDGGRLPTAVEWEYAATGGAEQRLYPWGNTPEPQAPLALFGCDFDAGCTQSALSAVGSHEAGAARWGHQDLAGSLAEWLDAPGSPPLAARAFRGGSWVDDANALRIADQRALPPEIRLFVLGFRCAHDPAPGG